MVCRVPRDTPRRCVHHNWDTFSVYVTRGPGDLREVKISVYVDSFVYLVDRDRTPTIREYEQLRRAELAGDGEGGDCGESGRCPDAGVAA